MRTKWFYRFSLDMPWAPVRPGARFCVGVLGSGWQVARLSIVAFMILGWINRSGLAQQDDSPVDSGSWANSGVASVDMREFLDVAGTRPDNMPSHGQVVLRGADFEIMEMSHWEERVGSFEASRQGRYGVWLQYVLERASLGVQCQIAGARMKGLLRRSSAAEGERIDKLGEVDFADVGENSVRILTPLVDFPTGFVIQQLYLVPVQESGAGVPVSQSGDGSVTLKAGDATTWSTKLVYQADGDGGMLCDWTEIKDFAQWHFVTTGPEQFDVIGTYRCGEDDAGSVVEVSSSSGALFEFTVEPSGEPGQWNEIELGRLNIALAGDHRLALRPKAIRGAEVMVLQKLMLRPRRR